MSAGIYLVSPATAAASAIAGVLCSAETINYAEMPDAYLIDDTMLIQPSCDPAVEIKRGPNIKPYPAKAPLAETIEAQVMIKVGDNITTDHHAGRSQNFAIPQQH